MSKRGEVTSYKGEYRVGINFNPSADDHVGQIKRMAADLIDYIETINLPDPNRVEGLGRARAVSTQSSEVARLKSLAQNAIEEGAMWAVKAATKPAP